MNCLCRSSKIISVRIVLLDETDFLHELKDDLPGQSILDVVFSRLNLIETPYFGIRYLDHENQTHWLDPAARISRQLKATTEPFDLYFGVKFYAADPCKLLEEITRYQLFLQVKQDVLQGRLPVSFELAAELGAYVVQSELGDYDSRRHLPGYVSEFRLLTNQTRDLELRVSELHQQLKGMTPSNAELNYLDKVKWHDLYGVDLHPVLGEDSVEYFLGLTPSGIVVLRNKTTVAHYYWPRIAKVYFKGRYFMLRVCDKNNEVSTYGFETPRKSACKHLWKCCVEHHAFFRLVRVAPIQPQTGASELFSLGSRFRYSGRTEKQAVKDAISQSRTPPTFTRTPSKRQPRRVMDELLDCKTLDSSSRIGKHEIKSISIPQPVQSDSPYRSTTSIPAALNSRTNNNNNNNNTNSINRNNSAPDSPRSTRSAPWARSQQRGLFGITASPRSVRSASTRDHTASTNRFRSSSVESHSSTESKSGRRHRNRSKRTSDNESELSRGSGRSGRSHNSHRKHRRQRSKQRRNDSGSENDSTRTRNYSGHRTSNGSAELVDSGHQWREVQRRQAESYGVSSVQQASVLKSNNMTTKYQSSETDGYHTNTGRRKHRKHRSPSDSRSKIWSSELEKHLQFDLVDTAGMTEDQLKEIPYTVVETHTNAKRLGRNSLKVHKNSQAKDRVDRIRGIYMKDESGGPVNGSIRSASTISSSKDCDKNSSLIRIMSSMSMGDFISPSGSSLSPLDSSGLRVSHEHTDSGLGADQDYAYSSERSSDSTKYGTNKSSGASVTSNGGHVTHRPGGGHLSSSTTQLHSVSNRKPPLHPSRQQSKNQATPSVHNSNSNISCNINNNNNVNNNNNSNNNYINSNHIMNNNRLLNHTIFQNNQYTFSLSRISGVNGCGGVGLSPNGYLETRPLSSASIHNGDGIIKYTSRGTKSDIGAPVSRRKSSSSSSSVIVGHHTKSSINANNNKSSSQLNNGNSYYASDNNFVHKNVPSISADFMSYIAGQTPNTVAAYRNNTSPAIHQNSSTTTPNNGSYLENYTKTATNYYQNATHGIPITTPYNNNNTRNLGPLLYLESGGDSNCCNSSSTKHNNMITNRTDCNTKFYQSNKNNLNTNFEEMMTDTNCITELLENKTNRNCMQNNDKMIQSRSNSLELILTPIIQSSRRAQ